MHVENDQVEGRSLEDVSRFFTTMAEEEGLEPAFRMFNTRIFRENLSIPTSIWNELEPSIREKINEIRKNLKAKRPNYPPKQKFQISTPL